MILWGRGGEQTDLGVGGEGVGDIFVIAKTSFLDSGFSSRRGPCF